LTYFPVSFTYLIYTINFGSFKGHYNAAGNEEENETYVRGVWCEVFSVENCSGRTYRHIWNNDIKVGTQQM